MWEPNYGKSKLFLRGQEQMPRADIFEEVELSIYQAISRMKYMKEIDK
jgi:hypothetical protein